MSSDVLRLLADQDLQPTTTDAPQETVDLDNPVPYDAGLIAQLEEHGPEALRMYGQIFVRTDGEPGKYNAALWYAMAHDLHPEHRPDLAAVVITDPKATK